MRSVRGLIVGMAWLCCLTALSTAAVAADDDFFTHLHTEKAMANVTVSPGRAGPVEIVIQLETSEEKPLLAKSVTVSLFNPQSGAPRQTVEATHVSDNSWRARTSIAAAGQWTLGLGIAISESDKIGIEAPILIGTSNADKQGAGKDAAHHHHH